MDRVCRTLLVATVFLALSPRPRAQAPADPSGHWEGSIEIPGSTLNFVVDLEKNSKGELIGALNGADVKNLPLTRVAVEGRSVSFQASADQPYKGELSADGKSMSGTVILSGYSLPLDFVRTGDPRIEPPPTGAPIGKELEGTWSGTLIADTRTLRLVLTMANQPDGRAIARVLSVDEGGLIIPVVITQRASSVSYISNSVSSSWAGALNAEGTELAGTFTQGAASLPLTFRRQP